MCACTHMHACMNVHSTQCNDYLITAMYIHRLVERLICSYSHRREKGWGYGAAALPDFKSTP